MASTPLFKQLKLVEEAELDRLIEKQIRSYDPYLRSMVQMRKEMDSTLSREDLTAEEKLALYQSAQQRYSNLKPTIGVDERIQVLPPPTLSNPIDTIPIIPPASIESSSTTTTQTDPKPHIISEDVSHDLQTSQALTESAKPSTSSSQSPIDDSHHISAVKLYTPQVNAKYLNNLNSLSNLIASNPSYISADPVTGEAIIHGNKIPDSSYSDLVRSLFHSSVHYRSKGNSDFLSALGKLFRANPTLEPESIIVKKEYLPALAIGGKELPKQTGKGKVKKRKCLPPGKKIKILKCY